MVKEKRIMETQAQYIALLMLAAGVVVMFLIRNWWPSLLLVIGLVLVVKQGVVCRWCDALMSGCVFFSFFIMLQFQEFWSVLLPVILTLLGVYVICKEWVFLVRRKWNK